MTRLLLGIESSCDETAAAVVADGRQVLSSVVYSQIEEHGAWGGVVPEIAGRSHLRAIRPAVEDSLEPAGITPEQLAGIAVTHRPGLLGSLLIGTTAAKAWAWAWQKPLIAVHHIEAHSYAALMDLPEWEFPYITMVVSGGHTSLYRSDSPRDHVLLGCTRDDAAGEALDKAAKMLGLGYPGGPAIQEEGRDGDAKAFPFKLPMLKPDSLEFSFSGLKTALLYTLKGPGGRMEDPWRIPKESRADLCASFESAVVTTLAKKCVRASQQTGIPRILVGGGVACNRRFRDVLHELADAAGLQATFAPPAFCTDNAVMIAGLGHEHLLAGDFADLDLEVYARG